MFFGINKLKEEIRNSFKNLQNSNKILVDDFVWEEVKEKLPGCIKEIKLPAAQREITKFIKKNGKHLIRGALPIIRSHMKQFLKRKTKITLDDSGNYRNFETNVPIDQKLIDDIIKLSPLFISNEELPIDINDF